MNSRKLRGICIHSRRLIHIKRDELPLLQLLLFIIANLSAGHHHASMSVHDIIVQRKAFFFFFFSYFQLYCKTNLRKIYGIIKTEELKIREI